jgi:hypothetical protein
MSFQLSLLLKFCTSLKYSFLNSLIAAKIMSLSSSSTSSKSFNLTVLISSYAHSHWMNFLSQLYLKFWSSQFRSRVYDEFCLKFLENANYATSQWFDHCKLPWISLWARTHIATCGFFIEIFPFLLELCWMLFLSLIKCRCS